MNWNYAVKLCLEVIANGDSRESRDTAKQEILKLATVVDAISSGEIEVSDNAKFLINEILDK